MLCLSILLLEIDCNVVVDPGECQALGDANTGFAAMAVSVQNRI